MLVLEQLHQYYFFNLTLSENKNNFLTNILKNTKKIDKLLNHSNDQ
jgi:hypothetical protein